MGNLHLVTGYAGANHITSADHGAMHEHLLRGGDFVMTAGENLSAAVVTNNQVRINDGELMIQGRHVRLEPGTYVDLTIENGAQSMLRNDLIVARYTRDTDTGVEACNLVVVKGSAAASNPADPSTAKGDLNRNKDLQHDFPLYRVKLNGLNIESIEALFTPQLSLYDLAGKSREYSHLKNGEWKHPINQRGKNLYVGLGEGIDGWNCTSSNWNVAVEDGYVRYYSDNPSSSTGMLQQVVDITPTNKGRTFTLAARVKGDYVRLNFNNSVTGSYYKNGSEWTTLVLNFEVPTSGETFFVALQNNKGANVEGFVCEWVRLFEGEFTKETLPEVILRDRELERLKCNGGSSKVFTATLPASGWSDSAAYNQTITVDGLFETDNPIMDVNLAGISSSGTGAKTLEAYNMIGRAVVRGNNTLQVYCFEERPTIDIPIILKVVY